MPRTRATPESPPKAPPDPATTALLIALGRHRWTLPILGHMQRLGGARQVELLNGLHINRESLRTTLEWLIAEGFIRRNPGYGHPLRPEYVFAEAGTPLGSPAAEVMEAIQALALEEVLLRKWALAVVWVLRGEACRFGELKNALTGITPRALTQILKLLLESGVLERHVSADYPPQVRYGLTARGKLLAIRLRGFQC